MNPYYYRGHRNSLGRRVKRGVFSSFLLILAPVLILGGILWFRAHRPATDTTVETPENTIVNLLEPGSDNAPVARSREETNLIDVRGGSSWAVASRQIEDSVFRHTIVASLPELAEGYTYEGWLLKEEPFTFFSTGTFQPNADGTFGLVFEGTRGKDYEEYTQVIVTLEPIDEDAAPAEHVLEGEFE